MKTPLKAALFGVGVTLLSLLVFIFVAPRLLEGSVVELVEQQISERLEATVTFEDIELSLLSTFPTLTIGIVGIEVTGVGEFEGVTLASVASLRAGVDLVRLLRDDQLLIEFADVQEPSIALLVEEGGAANYDILKPADQEEDGSAEEPPPLALRLQRFRIIGGRVEYEAPGAEISLEGLEHDGSATIEGASYSALSSTTVESLTVRIENIQHIRQARASLDLEAVLHADEERLVIDRLKVALNELTGEASGTIEWPEGQVGLDLELESGHGQSVRALVSAIPAAYSGDLDGLRAGGTYTLNAKIKGRVSSEEGHAPSFSASLHVRKGRLEHADFPLPLDGIEITAALAHPGGHLDEMTVDVRRLSARAGQSHVEGQFSISKPLSKPFLEATLEGQADFEELSQAYPLYEDAEIRGKVGFKVDLAAKGDRVHRLSGWMTATAFAYLPKNSPHLRVSAASLSFAPRATKVNSFYATYGRSDLDVTGTLSPLTVILRGDRTVVGNLMLDSRLVNLDDFLEGDDTEIPGTLDITIAARAKKLQRKKIVLSDMRGVVLIRNGEIELTKVRSVTHQKQVEALLASIPRAADALR